MVAKEKGDIGEEILLELAKRFQEDYYCIIFWSYKYPYATDRNNQVYTGNIKLKEGKFIELSKEGYDDEIDLVILTPFRIFTIECKARSGKWLLYDHWAKQNNKDVDKSPITQSEKHARHFYHRICQWLPECKSEYIVPLTLFVDKCKLVDKRSKKYKEYMKVGIANTFLNLLKTYNVHSEYKLKVDKIASAMLEIGSAKRVYR